MTRKINTFWKILRVVFIFFLCSTPVYAKDVEYYSHLTEEQIEDIMSLNVDVIENPWTWISEPETYVIVETRDGTPSVYWWNAPNIQMSAQNSIYDMITLSGYGSGAGKTAKESQWLVDVGNRTNANTALKAYGFKIPSPAYIGERPLITISIAGVLLPDGFFDGVGRAWHALWSGGELLEAPTNDDMNSLMYVAPRDYNTDAITFQRWVEDNWYEAIDEIKDNQVLLNSADQKTGELDGKVWVAKNIIEGSGLEEEGFSAEEICQELEAVCGKYYPEVAKNIIASSGIGKNHTIERIMPYELSSMNSKDAKLFNGVTDPRTNIQESLVSTGYDNVIFNMLKSTVLSASGTLAELTVALNGFSNFTFLESVGFKPTDLWSSAIIEVLLLIMLAAFVFFVVKSALQIFSKSGVNFYVVIKALCIFLVTIFIYNISSNSENTYNFIKNASNSIFSLANVVFENNESVSELYGTGDAGDKENVTLWLPYFNTWTSYNTNHTVLNSEQKINQNDDPEVQGTFSDYIPNIGGVQQTLWSTILAEAFTTKENYTGNIYRVVDHFMAPRLTNLELKEDHGLNLSVKQNENYNGDIQSSINFASVPFQVLILLLVIFKVILFFEFIFNIAMLLFNLALATTDKHKLILAVKELGASMLNVAIIGIIIGLVVYTSVMVEGFSAVAMCVFYCFILFNLIKRLMESSSIFTPKFFRPAQKVYYKVKGQR